MTYQATGKETFGNFQFNSLFVAGTRTSTYMGGIGIVFNNHTVWWQATMDHKTRNEKVCRRPCPTTACGPAMPCACVAIPAPSCPRNR